MDVKQKFSAVAPEVMALTSAVAFSCAQPPVGFGLLAPVALVPWLVTSRSNSRRRGLYLAALFSASSGLWMSAWIPGGLSRMGAGRAAGIGVWALTIGAVGIVPWLAVEILRWIGRRHGPLSELAAFSLGVLAVESLRSCFVIGLPWCLVGHSQSTVGGVAQLAEVGGVPLVSALVVACNAALAACIAEPRSIMARYVAAAGIGIYLTLATAGTDAGRNATDSSEIRSRALLVQPNLPPGDRWSPSAQITNLRLMKEQTLGALARMPRRPDWIAWPESSLVLLGGADDQVLRDQLREAVREFGAPLVIGIVRTELNGAVRNSVEWIAANGSLEDRFDKTAVIPGIESRARSWWLPSGAGGMARDRWIEPGSDERSLGRTIPLSVSVCFEVLYPSRVSQRRQELTPALVNLANDSWFSDARASEQQVAFASFRAIEQRLPLLRLAHGGISAVIDPFGEVVATLPFGTRGELIAELPEARPANLRSRAALVGLAVAGGGGGVLAVLAYQRFTRRRKGLDVPANPVR
jgi:apolipoprotein N-acyltransferase